MPIYLLIKKFKIGSIFSLLRQLAS
ncbi:uncharacterized protein FFMR_13341 [Fusarium fujikuroi]|nr:uncharacterized protein FFMR_13341 [Fusarium fujikuroi]